MMTRKIGNTAEGETKDVILFKALHLFAEKGYEGTTVQDIARAVGIKAASLYAHYKGKEAIFRAVFFKAVEDWDAAIIDSFAAASHAASLEEGLVAVLYRYVNHAAGLDTFRFWTRLYVFPPASLTEGDFRIIGETDADFAARLAEYCAAKVEPDCRGADWNGFLSALTRLAWGFILCDGMGDPAVLEKEIRSSLRLLLKGAGVEPSPVETHP